MTVAESVTTLLFPFQWQHIYLPIVSAPLHHLLDAPVPFLLGIQRRDGAQRSSLHLPHEVQHSTMCKGIYIFLCEHACQNFSIVQEMCTKRSEMFLSNWSALPAICWSPPFWVHGNVPSACGLLNWDDTFPHSYPHFHKSNPAIRDHFMLHEYLAEASLKLLCPRKEAVERQLGGDDSKTAEHERSRIMGLAE